MDVMLDIETLDTAPTSSILSIGACVFNDLVVTNERFYIVADRKSCRYLGLTESQSTIEWWEKQGEKAQRVFSEDNVPIIDALAEFSNWLGSLGGIKSIKMWGNGPDFDNVIVANAYKQAGIKLPWLFYNNRCHRTAKAMFEVPGVTCQLPRAGVHHNALDDAVYQAQNQIHIVNTYKNHMRLSSEAQAAKSRDPWQAGDSHEL